MNVLYKFDVIYDQTAVKNIKKFDLMLYLHAISE